MIDAILPRLMSATAILTTVLWSQPSLTHTFVIEQDYDTERLEISKPEHPEKRQLLRYICDYGGPMCDDDYISTLFDVANSYGVDPLFIAAVSILESGGGRRAIGKNYYGYCPPSGCTRFSSDREAIEAVSIALQKYNNSGYYTIKEKANRWCPPSVCGKKDYAEQIEHIIREMRD